MFICLIYQLFEFINDEFIGNKHNRTNHRINELAYCNEHQWETDEFLYYDVFFITDTAYTDSDFCLQ